MLKTISKRYVKDNWSEREQDGDVLVDRNRACNSGGNGVQVHKFKKGEAALASMKGQRDTSS